MSSRAALGPEQHHQRICGGGPAHLHVPYVPPAHPPHIPHTSDAHPLPAHSTSHAHPLRVLMGQRSVASRPYPCVVLPVTRGMRRRGLDTGMCILRSERVQAKDKALACPYSPMHCPPLPLVGCANGVPRLSPFHCSVPGPHGGGHGPSPLAGRVHADTPWPPHIGGGGTLPPHKNANVGGRVKSAFVRRRLSTNAYSGNAQKKMVNASTHGLSSIVSQEDGLPPCECGQRPQRWMWGPGVSTRGGHFPDKGGHITIPNHWRRGERGRAGLLLSRGGRGGGGFGPKTWCTKNGLTRFSLL